jgi:glycosyltransferase involved in cell wall biosynthesis
MRGDSKGALEWKAEGTDGDWTAWFPWRFGAGSYSEGRQLITKLGRQIPPHLINSVPFGAQGEPPEGMKCWPVHDHSYPVVTIVVTVGPGHEKYLKDSLDSVFAQSYPDWECYVVNDTGREWNLKSYWDNPLAGYPWARYLSTKGNFGVSRARNLGAQYARGQALIWLDVDDFWFPWLLEKMVAMIEEHNGVIYSDIMKSEDGNLTQFGNPEFKCSELVKTGQYPGSSVLVPRWVHEKVVQHQQGWDENIPGQEDWDYQLAAAAYAGVCAYRIEEPLFVYRILPDGNREKHKAKLRRKSSKLNQNPLSAALE